MLIPIVIVKFVRLKKLSHFKNIYLWFGLFIFSCGSGHFVDGFTTFWPAYRLLILLDWITAIASWGTIWVMFKHSPRLLLIHSAEELEAMYKESKAHNEIIRARIEIIEAFNRNVCHDLNAPLRSMKGFAEAMVEDYAGKVPEQATEFLFRIQNAAIRMQNVLGDLMRLSQITEGNEQPNRVEFSLTDMVKELVEEEKAYPKHEKHRVEIQEGMKVKADKEFFRLLMHQLISNAFKFTSRHYAPVIRIGQQRGEFFVADNGVGFSQEKVGLLFKPFSRLYTGDDIPGTGIGLTICKRVMDIHGGSIRAEGKLGEGAKFSFSLPNKS